MKDWILFFIERWAGRLQNWAWDKHWKQRDQDEWIKEYRKWRRKKGPHN